MALLSVPCGLSAVRHRHVEPVVLDAVRPSMPWSTWSTAKDNYQQPVLPGYMRLLLYIKLNRAQ